ncbi:MAG: GntR family transcriptional regulator [Planctomycetota bacterium]|nr:GntR family transcriptional regulator [Planctomycetota bacterium]
MDAPARRRGRPPGHHPKYRAIAASLRKRISGGAWPPGENLPSLRALARAHRVTEYTVRLALKALRSDGYAVRAAGGWKAARPESSCAPENNLVVEVLNSALHRHLASEMGQALQRGIETGLGQMDLPVYIVHGLLVRHELPAHFRALPLRGFLLLGIKQKAVLHKYEKLKIPTVLVDVPGGDFRLHSIGPDNEGTAYQATRRLISLGHRRIAFVRRVQQTVGVDPDSREREHGFVRAMREAQLARPAPRVFNHFDRDRPRDGSLAAMLACRPRVTAFVTADPGIAQFLKAGAPPFGLKVPRDVSIVTWMEHAGPEALSGWRIDFEDLGRRAARLLGEPVHPPQRVHVPCKWEEGATMAPPPDG